MNTYYARKQVGHFAKRVLGLKFVPDRYAPMYREIAERQPRSILEIGTHDGLNAIRMLHLTEAKYYGFDLFEDLDEETFAREFALRPPSKAEVENFLRLNRVDFELFAGDTRTTLKDADIPPVDFIFIDGGHSAETVASDWRHCQKFMHDQTVVYFDDYPQWGVGKVVESLDGVIVRIMQEYDEFPETGRLQLARVTRLRRP